MSKSSIARMLGFRRHRGALWFKACKLKLAATIQAGLWRPKKEGFKEGDVVVTTLCNVPAKVKSLTPGKCILEFPHGDVEFRHMGNGKGGARARWPIPKLRPTKPQRGHLHNDPAVVTDVRKAIVETSITSPMKKDMVRRRLGPKQYEEAPRLYRFLTWDQIWTHIKGLYVTTAAKICQKKRKYECPRIVRDLAP